MTALVHASDDVVASAAEMCIVESHVVKYLIIYGVKRGQSSGGVGIQPIVADSASTQRRRATSHHIFPKTTSTASSHGP